MLLIGDEAQHRLRARRALAASKRGPLDVEECESLARGLSRLREGGIDAVLLDLSLVGDAAPAICDEIRLASPHIAIVGLAYDGGEPRESEGSGSAQDSRGVHDCILARDCITNGEIDGRLLEETIRHAVAWERLARELRIRDEALARSKTELQEFAHVVSHDLREPLRMVSSYVQLLARRYEGRLDPDADRFIHYALDGAARMKAMIDDLLRYSRVGSGELDREPVALDEVFEEAVAGLAGRVREASARVEGGSLPTVAGSASSSTRCCRT